MNSRVLELLTGYLIGDLDFESFEDLIIPLAWDSEITAQDVVDQIAAEIALVKDGASDDATFRVRIAEIAASLGVPTCQA